MEAESSLLSRPPDTSIQGDAKGLILSFSSENRQFYFTPLQICTVPRDSFMAQILMKLQTSMNGSGAPPGDAAELGADGPGL